MVELFALPFIVGGIATVGKKLKNEYTHNQANQKEIIMKILVNNGLTIKNGNKIDKPKIVRSERFEWGIRHVLKLPYGFVSDDVIKLTQALSESLRKDVVVSFKDWLYIDIFHKNLTTNIPFTYKARKGYLIPIGVDAWGKEFYLNFDGTIAHKLGSGATGFGKSTFFRLILTNAILTFDPDLYLADLKGGVEFKMYKNLINTKGFARNISELEEMLSFLVAERKRREDYMFEKDLQLYPGKPIIFALDEMIDLADGGKDDPDKETKKIVKQYLNDIASKGRATRIEIVMFTQAPYSDLLPGLTKLNMNTRMSFFLPSPLYSRMVMDDDSASELPQIRGRALIKNNKGTHLIQTYNLSYKQAKKLLQHVPRRVEHVKEQTPDEDRPMEQNIIDIRATNVFDN